jgi:lipopolysaccharide transport system ATP-binding protein
MASASPAISVSGLSKSYRIRHEGRAAYTTFREAVVGKIKAPFQRKSPPSEEEFWALRDVSFDVQPGEVLGIIGRNGAGKSTLLKILSRITDPTSGSVKIRGRVASLLEVGTGFHPELTGRENIFLNGAILGMSRLEIKKKFDEIVAFADVERFLDTPVKRYSSGMYVRLAFAVAAHLEPEILIVDEVLAVGDAEFQKKCLGKMESEAKGGRTVIFVSHQMNVVSTFCQKGLLLQKGGVVAHGNISAIIDQYLGNHGDGASVWAYTDERHLRDPAFTALKFQLVDESMNALTGPVEARTKIGVCIEGEVQAIEPLLNVGFGMYTERGDLLWWSLQTDLAQSEWPELRQGSNRLICWLPSHLLNEGSYRCELIVSIHHTRWISQPMINAPSLRLEIRGGLSESPYWILPRPGPLAPVLAFTKA